MNTSYANQTLNQFAAMMAETGRNADGREVLRGLVSRERKTLKLLIDVLERLNCVSGLPDQVWQALDSWPHLVSGNQWMQLAESLPADVNPLLKQSMMRNGFAKWELEKHWRQFGDGV